MRPLYIRLPLLAGRALRPLYIRVPRIITFLLMWPLAFHVIPALWAVWYVRDRPLLTCAFSFLYLRMVESMQRARLVSKLRIEKDKEKWLKPAPGTETAHWLNAVLAKMWPIWLEPWLSRLIVRHLQELLSKVRPKGVQTLQLEHFSLGSKPPIVHSAMAFQRQLSGDVSQASSNGSGDHAFLELALTFTAAKDMNIALRAVLRQLKVSLPLKLYATDLQISGKLRLGVRFIPKAPFIGHLSICFAAPPTTSLQLKPLAANGINVMDIPLLSQWADGLLRQLLDSKMVEPNQVQIDVRQKYINMKRRREERRRRKSQGSAEDAGRPSTRSRSFDGTMAPSADGKDVLVTDASEGPDPVSNAVRKEDEDEARTDSSSLEDHGGSSARVLVGGEGAEPPALGASDMLDGADVDFYLLHQALELLSQALNISFGTDGPGMRMSYGKHEVTELTPITDTSVQQSALNNSEYTPSTVPPSAAPPSEEHMKVPGRDGLDPSLPPEWTPSANDLRFKLDSSKPADTPLSLDDWVLRRMPSNSKTEGDGTPTPKLPMENETPKSDVEKLYEEVMKFILEKKETICVIGLGIAAVHQVKNFSKSKLPLFSPLFGRVINPLVPTIIAGPMVGLLVQYQLVRYSRYRSTAPGRKKRPQPPKAPQAVHYPRSEVSLTTYSGNGDIFHKYSKFDLPDGSSRKLMEGMDIVRRYVSRHESLPLLTEPSLWALTTVWLYYGPPLEPEDETVMASMEWVEKLPELVTLVRYKRATYERELAEKLANLLWHKDMATAVQEIREEGRIHGTTELNDEEVENALHTVILDRATQGGTSAMCSDDDTLKLQALKGVGDDKPTQEWVTRFVRLERELLRHEVREMLDASVKKRQEVQRALHEEQAAEHDMRRILGRINKTKVGKLWRIRRIAVEATGCVAGAFVLGLSMNSLSRRIRKDGKHEVPGGSEGSDGTLDGTREGKSRSEIQDEPGFMWAPPSLRSQTPGQDLATAPANHVVYGDDDATVTGAARGRKALRKLAVET
mmetsp:Transcript_8555/g.31610  ORF Transcript_8555/g.31610 Transcript_8555/m.31610 type:complete len:1022 (-) Transcript_8555:111-3176(-)